MIRVIVADPDPATRKALTLLLRRKMDTTSIVQVGDVEALIHTLAADSPDLLLLDWRLYGSPATDSCRLLQKAFPHLKIVLPSVNAEGEAATKEAGADFIQKGAPSDELIATLTLLLRKNTYAITLKLTQTAI